MPVEAQGWEHTLDQEIKRRESQFRRPTTRIQSRDRNTWQAEQNRYVVHGLDRDVCPLCQIRPEQSGGEVCKVCYARYFDPAAWEDSPAPMETIAKERDGDTSGERDVCTGPVEPPP